MERFAGIKRASGFTAVAEDYGVTFFVAVHWQKEVMSRTGRNLDSPEFGAHAELLRKIRKKFGIRDRIRIRAGVYGVLCIEFSVKFLFLLSISGHASSYKPI